MSRSIEKFKNERPTPVMTPEKELEYIEKFLLPEAMAKDSQLREKGFYVFGAIVCEKEKLRRFKIQTPSGKSYIYDERNEDGLMEVIKGKLVPIKKELPEEETTNEVETQNEKTEGEETTNE